MANDTERLFVQLEARISDFEKRMGQAERRGTRTYNQLQSGSRSATRRMEQDMGRMTTRINAALASTTATVGTLNNVLGRVGLPLAGAAGLEALRRGAMAAVSEFSSLGKAARDVGIDVEDLQGIQRGFARSARISTDEVTSAFERFNRRVGEAVNNSGPLNTTVQRYGIQLRRTNGELRNQGELLREVSEAIRTASTDQERAAIAQAAFGDVGRRMAQTLAGGTDAINGMISEAMKSGHVIDRDLIDRAEILDDRFDDLRRSASTFFKTILVESVDALVKLSDVEVSLDRILRASKRRTRATLGDDVADALDAEQLRDAADAVGAYDRAIGQLRNEAEATALSLNGFAESLRIDGQNEAADQIDSLSDGLSDLIDRFDSGQIEAADFAGELQNTNADATTLVNSLQDVNAQGMDHIVRQVLRLRDVIQTTAAAARDLAVAAAAGVPEGGLVRRQQDSEARTAEEQRRRDTAALKTFLAEEDRLASRTRDQINLERELETVRRRSAEFGITLTNEQAEAQARANIAAREAANATLGGGAGGGVGGGSASPGDFVRAAEAIRDRTAALEAEAAALIAVAGSGREMGNAISYAYERARLLTAAKRDGLAVTSDLEAAIDRMADAYARAADEARNAADELRKVEDDAQRGASAMTDLFEGIMQGGEAAKRALAQLLMQLARVQLMRAFSGMPGASWLGSLMGGFAQGGYTGGGARHEPAGIVHKGEYVFSKPAVESIGADRLEWLHRSAQGYSQGGHVGAAAQPMPATQVPGAQGGNVSNFKVVNVLDTADVLEAGLSTREGEQVFMNFIRRNSRSIRGALG